MPIGYFKSVPKVEIDLDRDSYSFGDELRVRVNVQTDHPGLKVRRAVVELPEGEPLHAVLDGQAFRTPKRHGPA